MTNANGKTECLIKIITHNTVNPNPKHFKTNNYYRSCTAVTLCQQNNMYIVFAKLAYYFGLFLRTLS